MFTSRRAKFQEELRQAINTSYDEIGKTVVQHIKEVSPVITGNLRDSTDYSIEQDGLYVENKAPYAAYVEFGTYKQSAQPFMRQGIAKSVPDIVKIISDTMGVK